MRLLVVFKKEEEGEKHAGVMETTAVMRRNKCKQMPN